ncbi:uncharacterized protein LOC124259740 [Haliotis rubra]|uniref:uncharacterized protein LOC124259740 n=1 Tax=Haliotis rubra TaxID=36100 RepID=UPI001EE520B5|nr:uncharacterized protein LOC124259740 [Haliotis rubra]
MALGIGLVLLLSVAAYGQENVQYQGTPLPLCDLNRGLRVSLPDWGCQRFISCDSDGLAFGPQDCGQGTLFNFEEQNCDFPYNFECPETNDSCKMRAVAGFCNNYTQCDNGQLVTLQCGEGTVFSNIKLGCEYPWDLSPEEKEYCNIDV